MVCLGPGEGCMDVVALRLLVKSQDSFVPKEAARFLLKIGMDSIVWHVTTDVNYGKKRTA